ncbi:hypothetical protein GTP45_06450 [Pseudoduganella sp. FT55W]|uniref:Uncharacterized protein n=1 Tax=Duganella rivi TaxID=2666083 RepID=A0A7X4GN23_9BURK|nr:hypothetical protein [Duganella rivi]MYM66476.1 hypothetical protein [Duganella rivi]
METNIRIGMNSWIIKDGNYGDFSVGDKNTFALEFCGGGFTKSEKRAIKLELIKNSCYRFCGKVIYVRPNVWVIDVGVKAFWESSPPEFISVGDWIEGEIFLGIDPFFYKDYLYKEDGIQNLSYSWAIKRIERNATPWLMTLNPRGGKLLTRDDRQEHWVDTNSTDAWEDDNGRADYVLHVELCDL